MAEVLANAYLSGGRVSLLVRTTPGRSVSFRGCHAAVTDVRDIPFVLRQPGVIFEPVGKWADQVPAWVEATGPRPGVLAEIRIPPGVETEPVVEPPIELSMGWSPPSEPAEPPKRKPGFQKGHPPYNQKK